MVDIVLLVGKLLLIALLYLFLFAAIKTGVGQVSGRGKASSGVPELVVVRGPALIKGMRGPLEGPVVIGRSPGSDIVIADDFISAIHARIVPEGEDLVLEDLGSTNGTVLNGTTITKTRSLKIGDRIDLGSVRLEVRSS
jgi:hypothetical protein